MHNPPPLSKPDLAEGERLLAEGTPRPWFWPHNNALAGGANGDPDGDWNLIAAIHKAGEVTPEDAALIVYAVNHLEALLGVAEAAQDFQLRAAQRMRIEGRTERKTSEYTASLGALQDALAALHQQTSGET